MSPAITSFLAVGSTRQTSWRLKLLGAVPGISTTDRRDFQLDQLPSLQDPLSAVTTGGETFSVGYGSDDVLIVGSGNGQSTKLAAPGLPQAPKTYPEQSLVVVQGMTVLKNQLWTLVVTQPPPSDPNGTYKWDILSTNASGTVWKNIFQSPIEKD
jgi:hypothetical protein